MIPDELIFHIFQFLSPSEVIRLRLVSKRFSVVARDAHLWRTLYASARLPRPPGPFLWQSTRSLERTLVHSERVARTWTSQSLNIVSRINGPRLPKTTDLVSVFDFLFGRFLIWYDDRQVLCEDIETGHRQVVWNGDLPIVSIRACPLSTPDGLRVFLAVSRANDSPEHDEQHPQIKLLVFSPNDDTSSTLGPVTYEMNLPADVHFPLSFTPALLYFDSVCEASHSVAPMVIDPRTYALYRFPPSHFSPPTGIVGDPLDSQVVLSGTYIVSLRIFESLGTLVQIYVVPTLPSTDAAMGELRVTHETLADPGEVPYLFAPLRDPVVDPLTGDTTLRFLSQPGQRSEYETRFFYVDFTIPATDPGSARPLPLMFNKRDLFVFPGEIEDSDLDASSDGHGRGIVISNPNQNARCYDCCKFSIDASGETCTAVVADATSIPGYLFSIDNLFDGVRGRICYRDWRDETGRRLHYDQVTVFDLR